MNEMEAMQVLADNYHSLWPNLRRAVDYFELLVDGTPSNNKKAYPDMVYMFGICKTDYLKVPDVAKALQVAHDALQAYIANKFRMPKEPALEGEEAVDEEEVDEEEDLEHITAYKCQECAHISESYRDVRLYECGECGEKFTNEEGAGKNGNMCPSCMNKFGSRVDSSTPYNKVCEECNEGFVDEITAVERDGELEEVEES